MLQHRGNKVSIDIDFKLISYDIQAKKVTLLIILLLYQFGEFTTIESYDSTTLKR